MPKNNENDLASLTAVHYTEVCTNNSLHKLGQKRRANEENQSTDSTGG